MDGSIAKLLLNDFFFNKPKKQVVNAMLHERPRAERSRSPTSPAAIISQNWLVVDKPGFDSAQPSVNWSEVNALQEIAQQFLVVSGWEPF
jgi:hypothetical protein